MLMGVVLAEQQPATGVLQRPHLRSCATAVIAIMANARTGSTVVVSVVIMSSRCLEERSARRCFGSRPDYAGFLSLRRCRWGTMT
jgi:hypothetical protein